jgi:hypothetical protein
MGGSSAVLEFWSFEACIPAGRFSSFGKMEYNKRKSVWFYLNMTV